jgi:hypothetical protein
VLNRLRAELAGAGAFFLLGAIAVLGSLEHETGWAADGPQAGFFPLRLGILLMAVSAGTAFIAWLGRVRLSTEILADGLALRRVAGLLLPIVAFVAVSVWLGLYVGMTLYLMGVLRWQGHHAWWKCLAISIGTAAASYFIFERWFLVPLLKGPLEAWLGLT